MMMIESAVVMCRVCDGLIELHKPYLGMQVECPDCGEVFAVASLDPLELSYAFDMEEEGSFEENERRQA
jgi:lysine biosynthesis protein LysW